MSKRLGSTAHTDGIEIDVEPTIDTEHTDPDEGRFVFNYRIRVRNTAEQRVTLISRHWIVVDANGVRHEVEGEGVVGRQPEIAPGAEFVYKSFCPITTPWGTMEGSYLMEREDGSQFRARIARFYLAAPEGAVLSSQ
jgi:ApaG protein